MPTIQALGNLFTIMISFQAPYDHVITIYNLFYWLPQKVSGEACREGCNLLLPAERTLSHLPRLAKRIACQMELSSSAGLYLMCILSFLQIIYTVQGSELENKHKISFKYFSKRNQYLNGNSLPLNAQYVVFASLTEVAYMLGLSDFQQR